MRVLNKKYTCQHFDKIACIIPDMDTYGERLKWAIKNAEITQTKLARMAGIQPQTVQYLCDKKNAAQGSRHNSKFSEILKINAYWLETGKGDRFANENKEADDDLLQILGIHRDSLDLDQIEIIRAVMSVKKEDRSDLKKIVNKAPRRKQRGINCVLQSAGFQPT
jgi:hypothetical protein